MYIGRFAPTPSGRLHLGSLTTAPGAWLRARHEGGRILLRLEDLDLPRCPADAGPVIEHELRLLGFSFDGAPLYQSRDLSPYLDAAATLKERGLAYYCTCTRASLAIKPCTCAAQHISAGPGRALRLAKEAVAAVHFHDELLGGVTLPAASRPLTLLRRDGAVAYNLACVVDDARCGITEVVRGCDLLEATGAQLTLYKALGCPAPRYLHLPVLTMEGAKLSKQNHARAALSLDTPFKLLCRALRLLGQEIPDLPEDTDPAELLAAAGAAFALARVPRVREIALSDA